MSSKKNLYSNNATDVNKNTLEPISNFIDEQISLITKPINIDTMPTEVQDVLNKKLIELRQSKTSVVSRDFMTRKFYNIQNDMFLSQMDNIIKLINTNDIALNQLNKNNNSAFSNNNAGINLDSLINNILALPKLTDNSSQLSDDNSKDSTNPEQTQSLKEYDVLRVELINYCHVLLEGQKKVFELKDQVDKITTLKNAIIETSSGDTDSNDRDQHFNNMKKDTILSDYLKKYFSELSEELLELSYTIEEKIKSTKEEDKSILVEILNEINLSRKKVSSLPTR